MKMSQEDVIAAFRSPDETLTWAEIIKRCENTGCHKKTIGQAITAARKAKRIKVSGVEKSGRRGRSVLKYALVIE
jgi:hypothetical protein